jgi:hypothetical protein
MAMWLECIQLTVRTRSRAALPLALALALALAPLLCTAPARAEDRANVAVDAHDYTDFFFVVNEGNSRLTYSIEVTTGPALRVLVMNYDQFLAFLTQGSHSASLDVWAAPTAGGTVHLDPGEYVLLFDNQGGGSPVTFSASYQIDSGGLVNAPSGGDLVALILALGTGTVVTAVAYSAMKRRRGRPHGLHVSSDEGGYPWAAEEEGATAPEEENPSESPATSDAGTLQLDYCFYCGERVHPLARRCPHCQMRRSP